MTRSWQAPGVAAGLILSLACSNPGEGNSDKPVADFTAVCAALRCDFTDKSTDDVAITAREWSFGDQTTSSDASPFHRYENAGLYTVTLNVHDADGNSDGKSEEVTTTPPAIGELTCQDGSAPGGFVACSLRLEAEAGFSVTLASKECTVHGNTFRITAPVIDTLTSDGCYELDGKQITVSGPFPALTEISAEIIAPRLANPPRLLVNGAYPEWILTFEDGADDDFNDLTIALTATPTGN